MSSDHGTPSDGFEAVIAGWRREGGVPQWPDFDGPPPADGAPPVEPSFGRGRGEAAGTGDGWVPDGWDDPGGGVTGRGDSGRGDSGSADAGREDPDGGPAAEWGGQAGPRSGEEGRGRAAGEDGAIGGRDVADSGGAGGDGSVAEDLTGEVARPPLDGGEDDERRDARGAGPPGGAPDTAHRSTADEGWTRDGDPDRGGRSGTGQLGAGRSGAPAPGRFLGNTGRGIERGPAADPLDDDHFVPGEPPPLPRLAMPVAIGLLLLALGGVLIWAPGWVGVPQVYGLPLGLVSLAAGLGWLVLRLWPDPDGAGPPLGHDPDDPDDGAVV